MGPASEKLNISLTSHQQTTSRRALPVCFFQRKPTLPARLPRRPECRLGLVEGGCSQRKPTSRRVRQGRGPGRHPRLSRPYSSDSRISGALFCYEAARWLRRACLRWKYQTAEPSRNKKAAPVAQGGRRHTEKSEILFETDVLELLVTVPHRGGASRRAEAHIGIRRNLVLDGGLMTNCLFLGSGHRGRNGGEDEGD
jgi:hypothetical protein